MSRSGYSDDLDYWQIIMWRGAVKSAVNGMRGQAFLKEMLCAMDALHEHKLIANELEIDGQYCAIGAVGKARGINMAEIDPTDHQQIAAAFGIAYALTREIMFMNDEWLCRETSEARFVLMRNWVEHQIRKME